MSEECYEGWSILELMGHRRLGGYVCEVEIAGASFIRIDVPDDGGQPMTQLYSPNAVDCLTPTAEETARALARASRPAPVQRWELPALPGGPDAEEDEE